jgi:hypothetical protein
VTIGRLLCRIHRAAGGHPTDLLLYAASAAFALLTARTSTLLPHRAWGAIAFWAYAGGFILALAQWVAYRRRGSHLSHPARTSHSGSPTAIHSSVTTAAHPGSTTAAHPGSTTAAHPGSTTAARRKLASGGRTHLATAAYFHSAAVGHGRSAYALVEDRGRAALGWLAGVAAALAPLIFEAVQRAGGHTDRAQEEVLVVERMGERLLHDGTPYLARHAIAALPADGRLMAYSPYQPGMAIFGLPRAIVGDFWWTDARIWFALVTVAALAGAAWLVASCASPDSSVSSSGYLVRAIQSVTVVPICALTLATGGDDLPVLALCLLALALAATDRYGWAGVAVGAAAACKLFAFPAVAVLIVLALVVRRGRRLLPGAIGLPVLVLIPPFLVNGDSFTENVLRFPLGHGLVTSPAQSPFPGYLIAQNVPGGRFLAAALLVAVAGAITVRMIRRPPHTSAAAALIIGIGLLAAILLMPTTRFGYLLYPIAFLAWSPAMRPAPASRSTNLAGSVSATGSVSAVSPASAHSKHTGASDPPGDSALYRR